MNLNLPIRFASGPEQDKHVCAQALRVVFRALERITDEVESDDGAAIADSIKSIEFQWSGGSYAPELNAIVTMVSPKPGVSDDVEYVLAHRQSFHLGSPEPTAALADGILSLVEETTGLRRRKAVA